MNPPRHAEHVRDVFRSSACQTWSCEGGVMQSGEGPIPTLTRGRRRSVQRRVAVGLRSQGEGGEERFGPGEVLLLLEGEHRRDKPCGGLAVRANSGCSKGTVSTRQGIKLSMTFLPHASSAENVELLFGALEKILKATLRQQLTRA